MKFSRFSIVLTLLAAMFLNACTKQELPDNREKDYGYVQFKLYKSASYEATKAVVPQLQYLGDAAKIMVMMEYDGNELTQTLTLSASNEEAAEFGLRSEKLQLVAGEYAITSFTLYDKLDGELYKGSASGSFTVVPGGLVVHDILADAVERGKVKFRLVKDFQSATKAAAREYTFDEIKYVDIVAKETSTGITTTFNKLPADFSVHFDQTDDVEDGYQTSSIVCDTLVSLRAGEYVISSYTAYDSNKVLLETNTHPSL